jgi:GNAT superfamily N-acetyltransferase
MRQQAYAIRSMTRSEVDIAVDWAAAEGWNPGWHDAGCFHAADHGGFFVGLLEGQPVATISAVKYGDSFAFVGFYIVKPEFRGQGYGMQIWNAALATLGGRNVGLDGVVDQQENYRKSGFALAYRNIRYQGAGAGAVQSEGDFVPLSTLGFDEIARYDRPFFPDDRRKFLEHWLTQAGCIASAYSTSAGSPAMPSCANAGADTRSVRCLRTVRSWPGACSDSCAGRCQRPC